ncbi:MAG: VOC family protein [Clostridiales bacterium]|nr:VOC family protein [Clostridiales bacterium]
MNHIGIFVEEPEVAIDFYTNVLGGELLFTIYNESDGENISMIKMGDYHIELIQPPEGAEEAPEAARRTRNHFAIEVEDIQAAVNHVKSHGYVLEEEGIYYVPEFGDNKTNLNVAFFHGPSGERIEFFQYV